MVKIVLSNNKKIIEQIDEILANNKEKYGKPYCPCRLERSDDNVCICKEFRETQLKDDEDFIVCHCGKYKKVRL